MGNAAAIGRALRKDLSETISRVMILARWNVTNSTPVETTHAANNWILSLGKPFDGVDGSRLAPSNSAQLAGDQQVRNYDIGKDGRIYLTNNVFYMQYLDRGWSQQADANFVRDAMLGAARVAPRGRKGAAKKMLRSMAKTAYKKGY